MLEIDHVHRTFHLEQSQAFYKILECSQDFQNSKKKLLLSNYTVKKGLTRLARQDRGRSPSINRGVQGLAKPVSPRYLYCDLTTWTTLLYMNGVSLAKPE